MDTGCCGSPIFFIQWVWIWRIWIWRNDGNDVWKLWRRNDVFWMDLRNNHPYCISAVHRMACQATTKVKTK